MTPSTAFSLANLVAVAGWLVLAAGVALRSTLLRDRIAGLVVPALLSLAYAAIIVAAMPGAEGGFDSPQALARLFASPWLLTAGWLHYLAFDLFIGAWIARRIEEARLPRPTLIVLLPATFLLGPIGLLAALSLMLTTRRGLLTAAA